MNYVKMAANPDYMETISGVWYGWKMIIMIRPRLEVKPKRRMISASRALSKTWILA